MERRRSRIKYNVGFIALSVFGLALVIIQAFRTQDSQQAAERSQDKLARSLDALGQSSREIERSGRETARIQVLNTELQQRLLHQSDTIAGLSHEAIKTTTGGDSFCYVGIGPYINPDGGMPTVVQVGLYPLYDVVADVVDVEAWTKRVKASNTIDSAMQTEATLNIGNMARQSAKVMYKDRIPFKQGDSQVFMIRFSAQNGFWTEQLRLRRVNGKWLEALRILKPGAKAEKVVYEMIDPDFPREHGKVMWSDF